MAVHGDGLGSSWVDDLDVDQVHGLDYRQFNHFAKGVALRVGQEHATFADATVGGIHKPGGAAILGIEDGTATVIADGTLVGHGIVWDNSSLLWCSTALAGASTTGDFTILSIHPDLQWKGQDVTWAGSHEFDSSVDISGNVTIEGDVTIEGHLLLDSSADFSDAYIEGDLQPTKCISDSGGYLDEDDLSSDATAAVASQQSIKKFVEDGAHKATDGSVITGYRYCSVNDGAVQQVFTKYFTGILDADDSTSVAHSLTAANILSVSVVCYNGNGSVYTVSGFREPDVAASSFLLSYNATHIIISGVGAFVQGQVYRIRMDYTI